MEMWEVRRRQMSKCRRCGLSPAVGTRRRVHEKYEIGEGWEYPFRLNETCTVSGEDTLGATSAGWKVLTTPTKCTPFYTSLTTSHISRGAMRVTGVSRGAGNIMRGFGAGYWAPLLRRPIIFGCA
jgi:hypothetical protein